MTRIDHERNGRPPAEDDGALEAERPIERVRPVRVPGAVAGGRRPDPPANGDDAGNGGRRITDRWQSVRLRLGDGEGARGDAAARPVPPAEGEDPGLRRYRLPVGVLVAGMATAAVVAALAAGDDGNGASTPPPLDRTPPTRSAPSFVPLTAGPGAGHATAAARLTGSGGTLKLTVHANVPGRPYLVALMGPHGGKGVMGAKRGAARHTISVNWRNLARYDRLAIYAGPPAGAAAGHSSTDGKHAGAKHAAAKHSGAKHSGAKHAAAKHSARGQHAGAKHAAAKHSRGHSSAGGKHAGAKHSAARHHGTATHRGHSRRAATPRPQPILRISVDRLVRASGVHVAG